MMLCGETSAAVVSGLRCPLKLGLPASGTPEAVSCRPAAPPLPDALAELADGLAEQAASSRPDAESAAVTISVVRSGTRCARALALVFMPIGRIGDRNGFVSQGTARSRSPSSRSARPRPAAVPGRLPRAAPDAAAGRWRRG